MDELRNKKCHNCKCYRYPSDFIKNDRILKTYIKCRELCTKSRIKNHCQHGKRKEYCKQYSDSKLCLHSRYKYVCKECSGSQICPHSKRKVYCKECSDPIKVTIKQWISHCRHADKKYSRYDADRFIDKCFLKGLVEDYDTCYYPDCKIKLQYFHYQDNLATIERLDNSIGHIKSDCVLSCRACNFKRKSNNI